MMNVNFKPGFTVINYEYDNPSSGGQHITPPGTPGASYVHSETGAEYIYMDGDSGLGYYRIDDNGGFVYDPNVDVSKLIEQ